MAGVAGKRGNVERAWVFVGVQACGDVMGKRGENFRSKLQAEECRIHTVGERRDESLPTSVSLINVCIGRLDGR